jgi:hypothetical protein
MNSARPDSRAPNSGRRGPHGGSMVIMHRAMRWFGLGFFLELAVLVMFVSLLPNDSPQPMNAWQIWLEYTQLPGSLTLGVLAAAFGHALDRLPSVLGHFGAMSFFAAAFLVQTVTFTTLVWGFSRLAKGYRSVRKA